MYRDGPVDRVKRQYALGVETPEPILFFDGVCNLCNRFIDAVVSRDKTGRVKIASLQGETAARLVPDLAENFDSFVFYSNGTRLLRSEAVLATWKLLPGIWPAFASVAGVLPVGFRDRVYALVAKNRYRWFGKKDSCRLPTAAERAHFLP